MEPSSARAKLAAPASPESPQESFLAVVTGLQLATNLHAELSNYQAACFSSKPAHFSASHHHHHHELLARLRDVVRSLNDGIRMLSSTAAPEQGEPAASPERPKLHYQPQGITKLSSCSTRRLEKCLPALTFKTKKDFDDGFTWRKYGQKRILGKKFPRSYYRCLHKRDFNCPAMKHVEECEENTGEIIITYIGEHNCGKACHVHEHTSRRMLSSPLPQWDSSQECVEREQQTQTKLLISSVVEEARIVEGGGEKEVQATTGPCLYDCGHSPFPLDDDEYLLGIEDYKMQCVELGSIEDYEVSLDPFVSHNFKLNTLLGLEGGVETLPHNVTT